MNIITELLVMLVAILHVGFLVLEMFLWRRPIGLKIFAMSHHQAEATWVLAANQGLYNGFIAAGLFWGVFQGAAGIEFTVFFLLCVIVAGIFGAITASRKILYIQALPGILALLLVLLV